MIDYYRIKALRAKELFDKGLPFVKVYSPVRDGDKFIVLKKETDDGVKYNLSGGGVDDGETLEEAIKRELMEELNVEVEVIKELGVYDKLYKTWHLDGESFDIQYEIHVFDTKLKKKLGGKFGLEGEFDKSVKIVAIDKETLISKIKEFKDYGIKLDCSLDK